jgi:hypothetical protein
MVQEICLLSLRLLENSYKDVRIEETERICFLTNDLLR